MESALLRPGSGDPNGMPCGSRARRKGRDCEAPAFAAAILAWCICGADAWAPPVLGIGGVKVGGPLGRPDKACFGQVGASGSSRGRQLLAGDLRMGKVGGGAGWSRAAESDEKRQKRSGKTPVSKAMARPIPKVQARWNEGQPPEELMLTSTGDRRKWLSIFDFDGTLFRTPIKFMEASVADPPNAGLKPPLVPQKPSGLWFDNEIREAARQRCESEDHTAVLLSERPGSQKGRVTDMLEQQGLAFDQIILRPEGKKLGSPSQFKAKWVKNLLKRLKMSKGKEAMAEVFDDCPTCRYDMGRIEGVVVHAVIGRFGPPMEVGGNVAGHTPQDAITYGAKEELPSETPAVTYGYALAQGRRDYMEDRCVSRKIKAPRGKTGYFFAIFDGHGGSGAADWASERMSRIVENQLMIGLGPEEALREAFLQTDEEWIEQALMMMEDDSGSTALVALILDDVIYFASAGDGAGTVYRGEGAEPEQLSFAHKPDEPSEKRRIEALGGFVDGHDCARLNGVLAVSRGIGDLSLKQWVSADPEIRKLRIGENDEFLVISSDGMTDVLLEAEVGPIVEAASNVQAAAQELVDVSLAEGSTDNVGVLVIDLQSILNQDKSGKSMLASKEGVDEGEVQGSGKQSSVTGGAGGGLKRSPEESSSSVKAFNRSSDEEGEGKKDSGLVGSGR